jgi:hypothetical protein
VILLWGLSGDGPFDRVRAALEASDAHLAVIDQRDIPETGLSMTCDPTVHA